MSQSPEPNTNSITSLTDLELLKTTFDRLKIEYECLPGDSMIPQSVRIEEGEGYYGFYAKYFFDPYGKFIHYGIWE